MATSPEVLPVGLRERKKRRTRETIALAALELFERRGFHDTTIKDVAEAADVSPRTVSTYFPMKEDLVFPDHDEMLGALRLRLETRPDGQSAVDALRGWIDELVADEGSYEVRFRQERLIDAEPALRSHERVLQAEAETLLAAAVARDLRVPADALGPRMVAAAAIAALDALATPEPSDEAARAESLELLEQAMTFIDGGVRALQRRAAR